MWVRINVVNVAIAGIAVCGTEKGYGQPVTCFKCLPKQNSEDTEDSAKKSKDPEVSGIRTSLISSVLDLAKKGKTVVKNYQNRF